MQKKDYTLMTALAVVVLLIIGSISSQFISHAKAQQAAGSGNQQQSKKKTATTILNPDNEPKAHEEFDAGFNLVKQAYQAKDKKLGEVALDHLNKSLSLYPRKVTYLVISLCYWKVMNDNGQALKWAQDGLNFVDSSVPPEHNQATDENLQIIVDAISSSGSSGSGSAGSGGGSGSSGSGSQ